MNDILIRHLKDLADRSYSHGIFTFSNFLREEEQAELLEAGLGYAAIMLYGGTETSDRCVCRFGNPEVMGYDEPFPIVCLKLEPLMMKFGEELSHRDYLGSLMNLGIERELIGDILIDGKNAYIFCMDHIADYIAEKLGTVRHTSVKISLLDDAPEDIRPNLESVQITAPSERLDAVIARLYNMSRNQSQALFAEKKVFVNGRQCEKSSIVCKAGDKVSVRGFGKFIYDSPAGLTGKGRWRISIQRYI